MTIVKLSTKSQVVIPSDVRKKLGLRPNSRVDIHLSDDEKAAIIEPIADDPIKFLSGIAKDYPGALTEALLEERRKEKEREDSHS